MNTRKKTGVVYGRKPCAIYGDSGCISHKCVPKNCTWCGLRHLAPKHVWERSSQEKGPKVVFAGHEFCVDALKMALEEEITFRDHLIGSCTDWARSHQGCEICLAGLLRARGHKTTKKGLQ